MHVLDVFDDGDFSHPRNFSQITDTEEIEQALFERPANVRTRIVLLDCELGRLDHILLDQIGLAFDIESLFF